MTEMVTIGKHTVPVVPQKHAKLRHQLSADDFSNLLSKDYARHAYRLLGILVPALPEVMPEWEFEGYASEEAWKNEEYVMDADEGPTTAQVIDAFEKALMVSGADRVGKLVEVIQAGQRMQRP